MRSLSTALLLGLVLATNAACSEDPTSPPEGQTAGGAGGAGAAGGAATGGGTSAGGASATGGAGGMGQGGGLPLPEGCPDLSGVFSCPPYGNQSEFTLTVTVVVQDASVVSYTLEYSNTGQSHTDVASAAGISAGGYTYQCVDYQGAPSLAVYPDGKPQSATQNFINADGDYEADFGGSPAIVCARQP